MHFRIKLFLVEGPSRILLLAFFDCRFKAVLRAAFDFLADDCLALSVGSTRILF